VTAPDPSGASDPIDDGRTDPAIAAPERPLHLRPLPILFVFCGGAVGTLSRYGVALVLPAWWGLPWSTFAVNVVGAFLLGALLEGLSRRGHDHGLRRSLRLLIGTGFMGGFTTYSSLAVDGVQLFGTDRAWQAVGYLVVTLVIGALATALGILLAGAHHRSVLRRQGRPEHGSVTGSA
jgi:CrcB protein